MRYFCLFIILFITSCKSDFTEDLKKSIIDAKINDTINFEKIITKKWDNLLILRPYTELKRIEANFKINLSSVSNNISYSDNINTLVILNKKKAIGYFELTRNIDIVNQDIIIPSKNCVFIIKYVNNKKTMIPINAK